MLLAAKLNAVMPVSNFTFVKRLVCFMVCGLSVPTQAGLVVTERAPIRPTGDALNGFGRNLAVDGDTMLVAGKPAHVLTRTGLDWTFSGELPVPNTKQSSTGGSVAISGIYAVVCASETTAGSTGTVGAVNIYRKVDSGWIHDQVLERPDPSQYPGFGSKVLLKGSDLFVGASSSVHWFQRSGGSWNLVQSIKSPHPTSLYFGTSMDMEGDTLMIGLPDYVVNNLDDWRNRGAVFIYKLKKGRWHRDGILKHFQSRGGNAFGNQVALSGNRLAVTATKYGFPMLTQVVHVFVKTAKGWKFDQEIDSGFGARSIALRDNVLASGYKIINGLNVAAESTFGWDASVQQPGPPDFTTTNSYLGGMAFHNGQLFVGTPHYDSIPIPPHYVRLQGAVRVFDVQTTPDLRIHNGRGVLPPTIAHDETSSLGQAVLGSEARRPFTLSNIGHAPLNIASVSTEGAGFRLANAPPAVLLPGETFVCEVVFDATELGEAGGKLLVASNDASRPVFEVNLTTQVLASATAPFVPVMQPPRIVTTGTKVYFEVDPHGTEPLQYQWRRNGKAIRGATDRVFTLPAAALKQAGKYTVVVRNTVGRVVSPAALLGVVEPQADQRTLLEGRTFAISIRARGPGLQTQWLKNDQPLANARGKRSGVNRTKLLVGRLTDDDDGRYACQFTLGETVLSPIGAWDLEVRMRARVLMLPPQSWLVGQPVDLVIYHDQNEVPSPWAQWSVRGLPPGVQKWMYLYAGYNYRIVGTPTKAGRFVIQAQANNGTGFGPKYLIPVEVRSLGMTPGSYTGCVEPLALFDDLGGDFQFSITGSGGVSGRVFLDGKTIRFRQQGVWSADPAVDNAAIFGGEIPLPETSGWKLILQVNPNTAIATGELKNASGSLTLPVKAVRNMWPDAANPPPGQGSYTLALTPPIDGDPLGAACGRMTIHRKGRVRFTGHAGDGTTLTRSSALGTDLSIPLHWLLYEGRGALQAWLQVSPTGVNEVSGNAFWVKQSATTTTRNYRDGFGKKVLQVAGARYVPPAPGQLILNSPNPPGQANLRLDFAAAHQSNGVFDLDLLLDVRNISRVKTVAANTKKLSITMKPSTGLVHGHWYEGTRRGVFRGVLLPHVGLALGHALLPTSHKPAASAPIISGRHLMEPFTP